MFTLHSRLLPNGFSWQLSQQSGLHWARWERAAAPKECLQISSVPPHQLSCLRQDSRAAVRALGTGMGFPTAKLSQGAQAFPKPQLQTVFAVGCLIPRRRLGKDFGRHSAARWPWLLPLPCGEEQNQSLTEEGERISPGSPAWAGCQQAQLPVQQTTCLKVQCGWKSLGRRQKYLDVWRVRRMGALPLHGVAGWEIFYVHSVADLPWLQIPLHWTAVRSPNTLSKVRISPTVLVGSWGRSIQGVLWLLRVNNWLNPKRCSAAGFTPAMALQAKPSLEGSASVICKNMWAKEDPGWS